MIEFQHPLSYRLRRALNWVPLGVAYALFYMGRYNLTVAKDAGVVDPKEFGTVFAVGAWVYGLSFLLTGPLTDRIGGRRSMLIGTMGTIVMNVLMGIVLVGKQYWGWSMSIPLVFAFLYAINMHFQSYGAIAIVTIKTPWFHVRERGTFSTIFGSMITLGLFFAFDWGHAIVQAVKAVPPEKFGFWASVFDAILPAGEPGVSQHWWLFFTPAILISLFWAAMYVWMRNYPSEAGFKDFDTGEESVSATGERLPVTQVFWKIISHPVLIIVCGIEFCSGILRNGIMHWYRDYAKALGAVDNWIYQNWGLTLLIAGLGGAFLTGWASDRFFHSRRAPMAAVLYGVILVSTIVMVFGLGANAWIVASCAAVSSLAVIGVHGIMSGTSTADFGGAKNTGVAVGIVDGLVYLGAGLQGIVIGNVIPDRVRDPVAAADPARWFWWPVFLAPFALAGLILATRIWNALPKKVKAAAAPAPAATPEKPESARQEA